MQTKNIYIIYPQGYGGNYLSWAIDVSNNSLHNQTIKNPINGTNSIKYGNTGTSHLHPRVPTHQALDSHLAWVTRNNPIGPKTYVINSAGHVHDDIYAIMRYDTSGVFINIHAGNDVMMESYAEINSVLKWPTAYAAGNHSYDFEPFDCFDCGSNLDFRNFLVTNYGYNGVINTPLDYASLDLMIDHNFRWHAVRNQLQPHEVNSDTYLIDKLDYTNRIFELSCLDIASERLPDFVYQFLHRSAAVSEFNVDYLRSFTHNYIESQASLQWFTSVTSWNSTGLLDDYLQGHAVVQAQVIKEIFRRAGVIFISDEERKRCRIDSIWMRRVNRLLYSDFENDLALQGQLPDFFFANTFDPATELGQLIVSGCWRKKTVHELNEALRKTY